MNFIYFSVLPLNNTVVINQNLSLDLQNGIKQNNISLVKQVISKETINHPLPNGELPLHFAVLTGAPQEMVTALLEQGADPEIKDHQQLSAIDHTVLMKNESMLANILGYKIGKELKDVQEQIKCKGSAAHVNRLIAKIEENSVVDLQNLSPAAKAAYQGNMDELASVANHVNHVDANGLTPLHYAILGNQQAAFEKLIELGAKNDVINPQGDSLLHFAAISGSKEILQKLIDSGMDLNLKNPAGETALHYASAKENLAFVETLIKSGASPQLLDNQGMSSLALIGANAFQRDPLSLSRTQIVMFTMASLSWISTLAATGGWSVSNEVKLAASLMALATSAIANWAEFGILLTNLDKTWKKTLALIGMFGLAAIPPFNVGFQAWKTYHVAQGAFQGLKNCWKNIGYRNWTVTRNVVVHSANAANSLKLLYTQCAATYELCLQVPHWLKMWSTRDDEEAYLEACLEYLRFLEDRYDFKKNTGSHVTYAPVDPSTLVGLNNVDRILNPKLNPAHPEHALLMMSPNFTMDAIRQQGTSLYKKVFLQIMLKDVHPDKAGSSEKIQMAAMRLNAARDTLDKWVQKNTK